MQERYLGDSHDFIKYALLRHLASQVQLRLGVNWYLARPENVDRPENKDGEKRHHLKGGLWRSFDPFLFDQIIKFEHPSERRLCKIADWNVLPEGTIYYSENICSNDRKSWHSNGQAELAPSELVFLDPDNGFEVPSMTRRTMPKYALYAEAADYVKAGKAVIGIQFARQCDPVARAHEVRQRLLAACGSVDVLPIVRGRVAPNILFVTAAPANIASQLRASIERFCVRSQKVELIP